MKKPPVPRKKAAAKAPAAAPNPAPMPTPASAKSLLHAGLKALGSVRDDVVMRQNNVIDSLLGITSGKPGKPGKADPKGVLPRGLKALDPFGIRKFEDVFDQRVATSLQHLGLPSAEEFKALQEEVKRLRAQLEALQTSPPSPPKAAPTARRKR
ncbi:phasin family protein [Variovorax sp. LARHSF232]